MAFQGFPLDHFILVDSWKLKPRPEVQATEFSIGPHVERLRFDRMLYDMEFSMLMLDADFITFKTWFAVTINNGVDKFLMTTWDGEQYVQCICQFTAPYSAQYHSVGYIIVGFSLVVLNLPVLSDASVYLLGLYGSDFIDILSNTLHYEVHEHYPSAYPIPPYVP